MALYAIRQAVETISSSPNGDDYEEQTIHTDYDHEVEEEDDEPSLCSDDHDASGNDNKHDDIDHDNVVPVVKIEPVDTAAPDHSRGCMVQWEGHMVLESYIDLLSHMKREHPETFCRQQDTIKSAYMQTQALNLLGATYVSFATKPVSAMEVDDISHYRDLFLDMEKCFKFDLSWLRERVDRIEEVRFKKSSGGVGGELVALRLCIEAREKELSQLKAFYHAKMEEVNAAYKRANDGLLIGWVPR